MMSVATTGRELTTTTTRELARPLLDAAGRAANAAAATHLFNDYRTCRVEKTIRTQRAALMLWIQYLLDVGAVGELLAETKEWAPAHLDAETLKEMGQYAKSQQTALPTDEVGMCVVLAPRK